MPAGTSFIDIAVHEHVRARFAAGEALVVLSLDCSEVLWANGAGAGLFGYACPEALAERWATGHEALRRQLRSAASRSRSAAGEQTVTLRIAQGFASRLSSVRLSALRLANGWPAFLLSGGPPAVRPTPDEAAAHIVSGLGDADTHVAVLDATGAVLAHSSGMPGLALGESARGDLVAAVAGAKGRLVKRRIETAHGLLPAAIARLIDDPPLHLLFALEPEAPGGSNDTTRVQSERLDGTEGQNLQDRQMPADPKEETPTDRKEEANADAGEPFVFAQEGDPVRFSWRLDEESRFTHVSHELANTVGPNAADVVGRRFSDVARIFGFDADSGIATLIERRETWSGRSVLWPVQGTELAVPIDLAALPAYSRDHGFTGFRGFGIVRPAEAVSDPESIGLALADTKRPGSANEAQPSPLPDDGAEARNGSQETETPSADTGPQGRALALAPVVELKDHRPPVRVPLSTGEQAAFREIGRKLEAAFVRVPAEEARDGDDATSTDKAPASLDDARSAIVDAPAEPPERQDEPSVDPTAHKADAFQPDDPQTAEIGDEEAIGEAARPDANTLPPGAMPSAFAGRPAEKDAEASVLADLPLAVLIHSEGVPLYANAAFLALTGYADLAAFAAADGIDGLFANEEPEVAVQPAPSGAVELSHADGGTRSVRARLQSIDWTGRRALMLSLVPIEPATPASDETARDDAERAKERAEALALEVSELRSILETATDGVVILGEYGEIRSMNRSASALFDYEESETRAQPFAKLFAHESQRAVMDYLQGLSEHGVARVLNDGREVIGREASGGFLPLFMTIGRLSGSGGYCAVMRDITQWKRTEDELRTAKQAAEQASAHKSEFLARVSHEIRTPLNAIIGFSDMMSEQRFGPIGSPRYLEYAHDIGRSGKHVLDIVNDLLDISKIEAGEMEVAFAEVALNDTIADAVSLLQPQANSERVIIRTSLSATVPAVIADQRSLKQIALNLLSNAIRFTPAGGQIVVSTIADSDGGVTLRIRDTGVGMSEKELEQALKPFRQVSGASRPRGDGTGLGLPLTRAMVEANYARFAITSAPQEGTLITITFPAQRVLAE
ncbi:ATP-binding protein [Pararhizobium mangrovi]|uniref:histidine kinase n=1 Tax=Pararhizobium mangrovi TaxID=2590452 RepID=A0A506U7P5_9HYPH|nr:ATP-binding protein [Pararhizobium mangrovi]TPW27917.1 PAS domain S-box protein [Pararhizobium mangrovi]